MVKALSQKELERKRLVEEATDEFFGEEESHSLKSRIVQAIMSGRVRYLGDREKAFASSIQANLEA